MIDLIQQTDLDRNLFNEAILSNPDILNDFYDYSKVVVKKPWGYEYLIYQNDTVAVWILYLKSGAQTSMHCHPNKKTSLIVLDGEIECLTAESSWIRKAGDGLLLEKGVFHQSKAVSENGAFIMEIETPINKRDLVRLKDLYGREKMGYESSTAHSLNIQNYNYLSLAGISGLYNQKKRFGHCSLTFRKIENELLSEISQNPDDDVVSVIRGSFFSKHQNKTLTIGDTYSVLDLKNFFRFEPSDGAEILVVKRIDTDVKVSDYISRFFKRNNLSTIFAVPGDANVHLLDSIGREEGLQCIALQNETSASLSAEAFGKLAKRPAVLMISSGGSGPRALAGISNSWIDSTSLFVISGQARSDQSDDGAVRQLGNKSLNIIDIAKPVTKYSIQVCDPLMVAYHLEEALFYTQHGRPGPVWIDIPIDILGMTVDENELQHFTPATKTKSAKSISKINKVISLLKKSKRPVILAGNGINLSGAREEFNKLIDLLKIPVLTSRRGADLIHNEHPLNAGRPGTYGQRYSNFIIQNADLILSIGSRLSVPLIGRNTEAFGRAAKKIIVDIDKAELNKSTIKADIAICSSAYDFISEFLAENPTIQTYDSWWKQCLKWKDEFTPLAEGYAHTSSINSYLFLNTLSKKLLKNDIIIIDGGAVMHSAMQVFEFRENQRLISSTGLELPGFAIPASIGVSPVNSGRKVICICEDRGFQNAISELQTIIDYKLPVLIFVLQSQGNSTVRKIQKDFFGGRYVGTDSAILFGSPDFLTIGRAYGFTVCELKNPITFENELDVVLSKQGPVLVSVSVDSEQELIPRMGFTIKDDGRWIAKPLEDMYPFLDRELLKKNMIIDILEDN